MNTIIYYWNRTGTFTIHITHVRPHDTLLMVSIYSKVQNFLCTLVGLCYTGDPFYEENNKEEDRNERIWGARLLNSVLCVYLELDQYPAPE